MFHCLCTRTCLHSIPLIPTTARVLVECRRYLGLEFPYLHDRLAQCTGTLTARGLDELLLRQQQLGVELLQSLLLQVF